MGTKFNSTFKEKLDWCLPDPSSDKYSIECKLESLEEITNTVLDMKPRLKELEVCGNVIINVVQDDKKEEIKNTISLLNDQIDLIDNEMKKIKEVLLKNIEIWNKYEETFEKLSLWLKNTEDSVMSIINAQVHLENQTNEIDNVKLIQKDLLSHESEYKDLTEISE